MVEHELRHIVVSSTRSSRLKSSHSLQIFTAAMSSHTSSCAAHRQHSSKLNRTVKISMGSKPLSVMTYRSKEALCHESSSCVQLLDVSPRPLYHDVALKKQNQSVLTKSFISEISLSTSSMN